MTFRQGDKPKHDTAAAGRKGKQNSPWRKSVMPWNPNSPSSRDKRKKK